MKACFSVILAFFTIAVSLAQTKIGGKVVDSDGKPISYANVIFKDSHIGTITDDQGNFYLESPKTFDAVDFSFIGFKTKLVPLKKSTTLHMHIVLEDNPQALAGFTVYSGKTSKKNNPAIDILRKIWSHRRHNGVNQYDQYQYRKYEKLELDLNDIDSSMINSSIFKGMRFIFNYIDTSSISGKNYLPMFINESVYRVYGDNTKNEKKSILLGNRNSGFNDNHQMIAFLKDLYKEYDVYNNYINLFGKSFVSPLSRTGIDVYNYVLADSAFIGNKWCYRIVYYPRRKSELTFKGDFWVNDTTWAIKKISLAMDKKANINWVNGIFIEQEFKVINDSTFVITRDHFMSDFALLKKKKAHGVYSKRTTLYDDYKFNIKKPDDFFENTRTPFNRKVYHRSDEFWQQNRIERLTKDEREIYKMLDTLKTTRAFKRMYNIGTILTTGYIGFNGFDYGPILSTFGYNDVEGLRLRAGGRTYFSQNDMWRFAGFGAYGFKDGKFKYGISGKWLIDPKLRIKLIAGHRKDIEQLGASLTNTTDVLGRSLASASLITVGSNNSLSHIKLSTFAIEVSPFKNFTFLFGGSHRELSPASEGFSLDYYTNPSHTETASKINETALSTTLTYTPGRKTTGYGVEQLTVNQGDYPTMFLKYTLGIKGIMNSDFDYKRLQLYIHQPITIGGFGKLTYTLELGKTFGAVPLGLLSVVPGNQTIFSINNSFPLLNYYEFVTDSYASLHLEHNFNGRLFSYVPIVRNWNLRELVGFDAVTGNLSAENKALNASTSNPVLMAPDGKIYWEWSVGIGNIFRILRIDFHFRGDYFDNPGARTFGVTGSFGIHF